MFHFCVLIGTRPEAIKMAPVILEAKLRSDVIRTTVISTGQHTTMLEGALRGFDIVPDITLDIMRPGQSLAELTSQILVGLEEVFSELKPDVVAVHGDTTSALAGSMASFYCGIQVAHVEAGLRTGCLRSPFPEEYNRRLVGATAALHFAPTEVSVNNLLREGVLETDIFKTGNTVIDALLWSLDALERDASKNSQIQSSMLRLLNFDVQHHKFVLITAHRRDNWGEGIKNICQGIIYLSKANPNTMFVFAVHLNPKVGTVVESMLKDIFNVILIPPQDYLEFSWLMKKCCFVVTDSGGIQEEAPALGKPVLVIRDRSERPEAIAAGTAKLVPANSRVIAEEVQNLLDDEGAYNKMAAAINPFGDGTAARQIIEHLIVRYS